MHALEYCRSRAAPRGSTLHYALLGLEAKAVGAVLAAHALVEEIQHTAESNTDASVAHRKLAWWLEELEKANGGNATHPVTQALIEHELDPRRLGPAVLAAERVLRERGCATFTALESYGADSLGIAIELGGVSDAAGTDSTDGCRRIGAGLMLARVLFELPRRDGRAAALAPSDELSRHDVDASELYAERANVALREYTRAHAERAASVLRSAQSTPNLITHLFAAPALVQISLAGLVKLKRRAYDPLRRGAGITPLHKLWIAWRLQGSRA